MPNRWIPALRWMTIAGAMAVLAACSSLMLTRDQYTFSQGQLQSALEKKFPFNRRLAQVFDVTLTHPRLTLLPDTNRVAVSMDAALTNPLTGNPVRGTFALESALAYDPATHAVVLQDPSVQDFSFEGLSQRYGRQLNALGGILAEQLLQGYPIYTFKPEQLFANGLSYEPGQITVLPDGVSVKIERR